MDKRVKTSFYQYVLCHVCRTHHNCGVKHIYSQRHQQNLKQIFKKSVEKVSLAKQNLTHVEIHDEEWDSGAKFWCYFCSSEILKHCVHNNLMVKCLGMINHLSGQEHFEAVRIFLKENRVAIKRAERYILKKDELLRFLGCMVDAETQYLKKMQYLDYKDMKHIRDVEKERQDVVKNAVIEITTATETSASEYPCVNGNSHSFELNEFVARKKQKLKKLSKEEISKIPPWLLPDDDDDDDNMPSTSNTGPLIGPTIDDLAKHVEKMKKKGLNPKRVGADFNHKATTSSNWLPSFGRVWNQGRRKQSKIQYENEMKRKAGTSVNRPSIFHRPVNELHENLSREEFQKELKKKKKKSDVGYFDC